MNEPLKDGICVFLHNFQLRRNVQQQQRGAAAHFAVASESHEAATSYLSFNSFAPKGAIQLPLTQKL